MQVHLPRTLDELWSLWQRQPQARLLAGGTDLLVKLRAGAPAPPALIGLERLAELQVFREEEGSLFLGAGLSHTRLLTQPLLHERLPILAQALLVLGSPLVRNRGTLGGNLVTASPAGDTLAPLYALEAQVELLSPAGARRLPISAFILGPGRVDLAPGELLAGALVPLPAPGCLQHYEKVGRRAALAISLVSLAALIRLSPAGLVEEARLAWGSVGPTAIFSRQAAAALMGQPLTRESLAAAAALARAEVSPIDDLRATAAYRRQVAGNLLLRLARG